MVFRGKPSKACTRCRVRRLKCDLQKVSCSSCIRAGVPCTGYRDTDSLRINNQTQHIVQKAQCRSRPRTTPLDVPPTYHLSIETRARTLFFASYVTGSSKAYGFLNPFFSKVSSDYENIALSIDAKYVAAIRKMNKSLQDQRTILKGTLGSTLLLDIFEKMNPELISLDASGAHIKGAMALLLLKRLETFDYPAGWTVLRRLSMNYIVSCICKEDPVAKEPYMIRKHLAKYVDVADPNWTLMGLMMKYANLMARTRTGSELTSGNSRGRAELDQKFEELILNIPMSRTFRRVDILNRPRRYLDDYIDFYLDRASTWTWNFLRCLRILLCETGNEVYGPSLGNVHSIIEVLIREICASVAQSVDCNTWATHKPLKALSETHHEHNIEQLLDVRILIFPLFVAARSWDCPAVAREWIENELQYIADHFAIKEAAFVFSISAIAASSAEGVWDDRDWSVAHNRK
ncbi:hypothetical protein P154DRAFT_585943 [Amniculicola lignicola CBS 123094]|uniref:Zn(2)-C6 fungal-type domain-containing protein n=1 Tax=Amniculicola lignicola CBS 123094 TaxID=1392246 RepID=A0A6A5W041_9PLEO|nr:hypothetical protein P154DRAFT_585943 [Amniculicola lignicola CBS 123094]